LSNRLNAKRFDRRADSTRWLEYENHLCAFVSTHLVTALHSSLKKRTATNCGALNITRCWQTHLPIAVA